MRQADEEAGEGEEPLTDVGSAFLVGDDAPAVVERGETVDAHLGVELPSVASLDPFASDLGFMGVELVQSPAPLLIGRLGHQDGGGRGIAQPTTVGIGNGVRLEDRQQQLHAAMGALMPGGTSFFPAWTAPPPTYLHHQP